MFEKDTDAYAQERDGKVMKLAKEAGVEVIMEKHGRTLYDPDLLVKENGGHPTMSISQVGKAGPKIGDIPKPISAPKHLPDPGDTGLDFEHEQPPQEPDINAIQRQSSDTSYTHLAGPNQDFAVPTLSELGMEPATTQHRGGESIALNMLEDIIANKNYTATFQKPNTAPTAFDPQATTLLSPHLHFGTISSREFYWRVQEVVNNYKGKASTPPTSLTGQLLFRDMYFGAQAALGYKFGQTVGNSHCRFIPWHLPSKVDTNTGLVTGDYTIDSQEAESWFQRWKWGRTGFPWIDALMRQLRQEGWIHHLGRHAVACFLTRGGCYIDWERGAEVFEEWLIDHEAASNIGNWQWLSCTAFYSQFYRCYSPIAFPQKWDKEGKFVKRFVPELENLDKKYIYEPWKAPIQDQKKAGCLIKGNECGEEGGMKIYPKPMFDFAGRRTICLDGMKKAYKVHLYGDNPKVLDGTWRELFDDDAEGPTEGTRIEDALNGDAPAKSKITKGVSDKDKEQDGAIEEDEGEAAEKGGENKGGDVGGSKRKRGQATLDGHFKKSKTAKKV